MSRKEHLCVVPTNVGTITVIGTTRKNRPAGLRKPYEYVLPIRGANTLVKELRDALKDAERNGFQCSMAKTKAVSRGIKLELFLLGYRPGLCGTPEGVSKALYGETVRAVQRALTSHLGLDARVYADPYSQDDKFQMRFETYVMYDEHA